MSAVIRVAVAGANGRMGKEAVAAVRSASDMALVAEIGRGDNLAGSLAATSPEVLVDFTVPDAVMANTRTALAAHVVPIIGATGLGPADLDEIRALCERHQTACLFAPNFAIGALLLMRFAKDAARFLPDAEIIEMHHERKLDAPSGTAVRTAEMIAAGRESGPAPVGDMPGSFEKVVGVRGGKRNDVRIHSVRLPGFVASQEVIFGGPGQRLSLRHDSIDRASFMPGVLLAIRQAATLSGFVYGLENLL